MKGNQMIKNFKEGSGHLEIFNITWFNSKDLRTRIHLFTRSKNQRNDSVYFQRKINFILFRNF